MQTVDLRDIIASAIEIARPLIESRRHKLSVTQPGHAVFVSADPTRMTQVVGNLLNNAAKYGEEQGRIKIVLEK